MHATTSLDGAMAPEREPGVPKRELHAIAAVDRVSSARKELELRILSEASVLQQQSNDYGFIPDAQSDFPFAVYVDDWALLAALLVAAVGVFVWLRRVSARQ